MKAHVVFASMPALAAGLALAGDPPASDGAFAAVLGGWDGTLQYRDDAAPRKSVTLPVRLTAAPGAEHELVLLFTYAGGPPDMARAYDRLTIDGDANAVTWAGHPGEAGPRVYRITGDSAAGTTRQLVFEGAEGDHLARYTLALAPLDLSLTRVTIAAGGEPDYRDYRVYDFTRPAREGPLADCTITHPPGGIYGNDALHAVLPPNGKFVFAPGGAGFTDRDGAMGIKFGWFRHKPGTLHVGGRRLDGEAGPARAYISSGYGDEGFQPVYLVFPTPGCWEITGGVGDARLSFVLRVERIGAGPPSWYPFPAPGWRATSDPAGKS